MGPKILNFGNTTIMSEIKISIIIPVYNTEKYLRKCIDSCLNQSLKEIEIILINDASTDGSSLIIKEYVNQYADKLRLIELTENHKQGYARNQGIYLAKGEFLCFLDSDDFLDKNACLDLYNVAIERKADIVITNGYSIENGIPLKFDVHTQWDIPIECSITHFTTQCYKIVRRDLIVENDLFFPEGVFHEDMGVVPLWMLQARKVEFLEGYYWNINRHDNSTTTKLAISEEGVFGRFDVAEYLLAGAKRLDLYDDNKAMIDAFIIQCLIGAVCRDLVRYPVLCESAQLAKKKEKWICKNLTWEGAIREGTWKSVKEIYEFLKGELDVNDWELLNRLKACEKHRVDELICEIEDYGYWPVIYGIGKIGEYYASVAKDDIGLCDSSPQKQMQGFQGRSIMSLEELEHIRKPICLLVTVDRKFTETCSYISDSVVDCQNMIAVNFCATMKTDFSGRVTSVAVDL